MLLISYSHNYTDCDICHFSKQHRQSFHLSINQITQLFDLIHLDVLGPYKRVIHNNYSYFLAVVDDISNTTWVFLFATKTYVLILIMNLIASVNNQFHTSVHTVRSENGTKFTNADLTSYFYSLSIIHYTSCPPTPQQNGQVERKN